MSPSPYRKRKIQGVTYSEHKLIWEAANGPVPDGFVVHHRNGNKRDNRLANLELLSHGDHSRHHNEKHPRIKVCAECGKEFKPAPTKRARAVTCSRECFRAFMRSKRNNAKLSREQHAEIRRRIAAGERQKDLATEFGVSAPTITWIKQHP